MNVTEEELRTEDEFWSRAALAARQGDAEPRKPPFVVIGVIVALAMAAILLGLLVA